MSIRFVTDSSSDYSFAEANALGLSIVPMTISAGNASYADGIDLTQEDFYEMLLSGSVVPKTSQPSPVDFQGLFENARAEETDLIAILISGGLSGTVQSANIARETVGYDRIFIIDSQCASGGIQLLIREGLRLAAEGVDAAEIARRLEALKHRVRIFLGVDTLKYLYRGGRLSRTEAGIGSLARIRPLLELRRDGTLGVAAKCIGVKMAVRKLAELIRAVPADPRFPMRFIYSYDDTNCRDLMRHFPGADSTAALQIGPTLATHAGPGVYGAIFVEKE